MKGEDPVGMVDLDTICPISILFRKFIIRYVFVIRSMEGNRDPIFAGYFILFRTRYEYPGNGIFV